MSLEQYSKKITPVRTERETFIESEGQYPKIRFIFVPTIDKDNVETVDIPTKFNTTAELSRHNIVTEKFQKFSHGNAEELLIWLKHRKVVDRTRQKLSPEDKFAITGEVALGDGAMSQWEECKN